MSQSVNETEKIKADKEQFALDVLTGFCASNKYLNSKYFYDDRGSELFSKITDTEDYYPTECEFSILREKSDQIADIIANGPFNLIELGAGDGRKTKILLKALQTKDTNFDFIPVDISEAAVLDFTDRLKKEFPDLNCHGVIGEYMQSIQKINQDYPGRNVVLFLGSNLGNFDRGASQVFLRTLWKTLNRGDLLFIGFDLKKNIDVMLSAYNDSEGQTKAFNLNILTRINNELGGEFDVDKFEHFGTYNPLRGAMESYLISKVDQSVYISALEKKFHFKAFEPIHMEYSYKYLPSDIEFLARESGFRIVRNFYDEKKYFCDSIWEVQKF